MADKYKAGVQLPVHTHTLSRTLEYVRISKFTLDYISTVELTGTKLAHQARAAVARGIS